MEEFKDACLGLDVRSEEIAADLRTLPQTIHSLSDIDKSTRKYTRWRNDSKPRQRC